MGKIEKRSKKYYHALLKNGIIAVEEPTQILVLCNTGLVNGLSEEVLLRSFKKYGEILNILMPPGKSYCFVCFSSKEAANECFISCNGKLNIGQDEKPVYLSFTETLPEIAYEKEWNISPPGFILLEDFLTEDEENILMSLPNFQDSDAGSLKNRQVKHYGYEFNYQINDVDKDNPLASKLPEECNFLWGRLGSKCEKFKDFFPDQLTINQYLPGQGIPAHIDTHSSFIDPLISLSLGSDTTMEFKNENLHYCVILPRRSLAIMSEESRYLWTHGITPRKYDVIKKNDRFSLSIRETRISYTFRQLRNAECNCKFYNNCDSYLKRQKDLNVNDKVAEKLENIHVHEIYENIANHFSDTRHKPWPNIIKFLESLETGSFLVDIGCGNGKYLGVNKNIYNLGCDRSLGLLDVCRQRGFQSLSCDCLSIPLRDSIADACICIAVIHHLASEERRLKALKEIVRILKPNGRALIYVWAKDQFSNKEKSKYIKNTKNQEIEKVEKDEEKLLFNGISLPVHTNRTQFKHKDLLVPWKLKRDSEKQETFFRFYHVYEKNELEKNCLNLKNIEVISNYYDQGNWCIILKKINE